VWRLYRKVELIGFILHEDLTQNHDGTKKNSDAPYTVALLRYSEANAQTLTLGFLFALRVLVCVNAGDHEFNSPYPVILDTTPNKYVNTN